MTTIDTLRSLQKRIREATGPDRELDKAIWLAIGNAPRVVPEGYTLNTGLAPRYTTDLDGLGACVALMRDQFPGALWAVWDMEDGPGCRLLIPGKSGAYHDGVEVQTPVDKWTPPTVCAAMIDCVIAARIAVMAEEEAKEKADA